MTWYQRRPKESKDFKTLTETYNEKYGHYNYAEDSRSLDSAFPEVLMGAVGNMEGLSVLVCGSNSGYEVSLLSKKFPKARFTAVDISTEALGILSSKMPHVSVVHASMESLSFQDKSFDLYLNCRAIHSSDVNMEAAVAEAARVTKGKIVLSVSNGYRVGDSIVNGMYDYASGKIDAEKAERIAEYLVGLLEGRGYRIGQSSSGAELFIVATPVPSTSETHLKKS